MVWCTYNYDNLPIIKVTFNGSLKNEEEYTTFTKTWLDIEEKKTPYYFIFDTTNMGMINISYCYKISKFIKQLKKTQTHLKKSIIIVKNTYIKSLIYIVFKCTKPISPVYIFDINSDKLVQEEIENCNNKNIETMLSDYIKYFTFINNK
jgi:hypothetical protein